LVDSGAGTSCLNEVALRGEPIHGPKCSLIGLNNQTLYTLGQVKLDLNFKGTWLSHAFQVMPGRVTHDFDGLLGADFIFKHAVLNGPAKLLILPKIKKIIALDDLSTYPRNSTPPALLTESPCSSGRPHNFAIIVEALTEALVDIPTKIEGTWINEPCEIAPGLIVAGGIATAKNGHLTFAVVNTTKSEMQINNDNLRNLVIEQVQPVAQYATLNFVHEREGINRTNTLLNELDLEALSNEELDIVQRVAHEYSDVFHLPGDHLTATPTLKHEVNLTSEEPIFIKQYRTPLKMHEEINSQIKELITDGIIRPSSSPFNFPLICVPKKGPNGEKKIRMVIDFRALNHVTRNDPFPLPNISDILDRIGEATLWCTYDLKSGFHQVEVKEEHKSRLAFSSAYGHYEFNRMPFGLRTAPATMQRLMNVILGDNSGGLNLKLNTFVYMDDIVQFASSPEEMADKMCLLFELLRKHNLKLQPAKCHIMRREINFLGFHVSAQGVRPGSEKVECVKNFPTPKSPTDVKSFLGLCNYYRRFVDHFAKMAEPLVNLTRKGVEFQWNSKCQESFEYFKKCLITHPILRHFKQGSKVILTTDASNYAIGCILSQVQPDDNSDLPVAYASRALQKSERNYSVFEKELLAIIWALEHFKCYCYGTPILIFTDHKPLVSLPKSKIQGCERLVRWRLRLEAFDYQILYKPGKENLGADALSRLVHEVEKENEIFLIRSAQQAKEALTAPPKQTFTNIDPVNTIYPAHGNELKSESIDVNTSKVQQACVCSHSKMGSKKNNNKFWNKYKRKQKRRQILINVLTRAGKRRIEELEQTEREEEILSQSVNDTIEEKNKKIKFEDEIQEKDEEDKNIIEYVLEPEQRKKILDEYHNKPTGGHQGAFRTYRRLKLKYKWPKMFRDIVNYCRNCDKCQRNKARKITREPLAITDTSQKPWQKVYLDIVGGKNALPTTQRGHKYILTFQDDLTKFSEAFPLETQSANEVAKVFVENIVLRHGVPEKLLTDQGANFMSNIFKETCRLLQISKLATCAYHPQTNGQCERQHKTLQEYLRHYVNADQSNWDDWLVYSTHTYNTTPHTATGYEPFYLLYGRHAALPTALVTKDPTPLYSFDDYSKELKFRLQTAHAMARRTIMDRKEYAKTQYDKKAKEVSFNVNDLVLVRRETRENKLSSLYVGPYKIIGVDNLHNSVVLKGKKQTRINNNRLIIYEAN
jgi:transposase InsO family protein